MQYNVSFHVRVVDIVPQFLMITKKLCMVWPQTLHTRTSLCMLIRRISNICKKIEEFL
jgi:hypothetical protein